MANYYLRVDGGIGRCIAATGAVKQFAINHPKDKTYVVSSFHYIFENIDELERVYNIGTPYLYEDHISKGIFLEPEPYNNFKYYKDEKHLATTFNFLLNQSDEFVKPIINLTENELTEGKQFVEQMRKENNKKIVLIQPWGSQGGLLVDKDKVKIDESYRSFGWEFGKKLNDKLLSENYLPFLIKTPNQVGFKDSKTFNNLPVRKIIALLPFVDGIIACDSFLHHAAEAVNASCPTVVLWGATNPKNLAYDNQSNIVSWKTPLFEPNRVPHDHAYYVGKNKGVNEFKLKEIDTIVEVLSNGKDRKESVDSESSVEKHSKDKE